jgi:hypothetical protein
VVDLILCRSTHRAENATARNIQYGVNCSVQLWASGETERPNLPARGAERPSCYSGPIAHAASFCKLESMGFLKPILSVAVKVCAIKTKWVCENY